MTRKAKEKRIVPDAVALAADWEPTAVDVQRLRERARAVGYELLTDGRFRGFHLRHIETGVWPLCSEGSDPEADGKDVQHGFHEIDVWLAGKEQATSERGEVMKYAEQ